MGFFLNFPVYGPNFWNPITGMSTRGDRIVIVGGSHLTAGPKGTHLAEGVHDIVIVHEVEGEA